MFARAQRFPSRCATRLAMMFALLLPATPVIADAPAPSFYDDVGPAESFLRPVSMTRQFAVPEADPPPALISDDGTEMPAERHGVEFRPRAEFTHLLKLGGAGLGVTDVEGQLAMLVPLGGDLPPLKIVPGTAARWWDGPAVGPNLPAHTYDFYADISWRPRPAEWLFIDLRVAPGFYSDLDDVGHNAFRPRGHGLAIVALSEKFQIIAGLAYANRVRVKVVPAGGIRYAPTEDTEFRLVFPTPKISHRVATLDGASVRIYLAGEFGGGAWAIRRTDGRDDTFDYSDLRLLSGVEVQRPGGARWYAELGYVFNRRVDFASGSPATFRPGETLLFRAGVAY